MGKISMKGVCDMHVHTNPDLRLRAYDDFELADAAVRVGARAIVIKTHLGFTVNRAYLTNQYVKKVYGENTGFTMYGGVVMNKVIGGINPEAVEKGLKLGAKEIWLPTQSAKRHLEKMGQDPAKGIELVRDGKVVPELVDVFKLIRDYDVVLGTAHVSPEEAFVVVEAAKDAGVKKIVITHPEWWVVDMSIDDQIRLVKDYDVILERCYAQNMGGGALAGGNFPTSNLGVVFRGLSDTAYEASPEIAAVDSFNMEMKIFAFAIFFSLILITIFRFGFKENRNIGKGVTFKKPESFTKDQKTTLTLMMAMMAVVLIFPLLNILMPGNAAVKYISGKVDVGLVAIIFTVIALLLKLAPQKEAIAKVPWNTIIMIAGAGMLIAVAVEAGTIEALSTWIGSNVPKPLVPIAFCLVGAIMSFFSSTTGVVAPALFPLIPNLAASVGLSAPVLFACTILGAQSSAISPFSSGGSLILGSTPKEEERNELFNRLLMVAVPISVITCTIYNFVIAMVL